MLSRCSLAMKSEAREEIRGCSPAPGETAKVKNGHPCLTEVKGGLTVS